MQSFLVQASSVALWSGRNASHDLLVVGPDKKQSATTKESSSDMARPIGNERHLVQAEKQRGFVSWSLLTSLLALFVALVATYSAVDPIKHRWYIFDPKAVHQLAQQAVAANPNNTRAVVDHIVAGLRATHPPHAINLDEQWIYNNAGGAMGAMYIIHASITEYLIIFGTSLGTEGHTGRHTADDYFMILEGEQWAMNLQNPLEKEVYPAGSINHMRRGDAKQYKMHEGCWALELAQGWIPPMLPFGFADTVFSTIDVWTAWDTVRITGREMIKNLVNGKI